MIGCSDFWTSVGPEETARALRRMWCDQGESFVRMVKQGLGRGSFGGFSCATVERMRMRMKPRIAVTWRVLCLSWRSFVVSGSCTWAAGCGDVGGLWLIGLRTVGSLRRYGWHALLVS